MTKIIDFRIRMIVTAVVAAIYLIGAGHSAEAAERYVREGAAGDGSGSDWANACPGFIGACALSSLVRGDTYYVADGSYGNLTLSQAAVGSSVIAIVKATVSNHGISTGWNNAFGDGQAIFGSIIFTTDFWVIDGRTRDEGNWDNGGAYGFRASDFYSNSNTFGHCSDNITVKYVDVGDAFSLTYMGPYDRSFYLGGFGEACENWTIARNFVHNTAELQLPGADNVLIEYNWFGPTWGKEIIRGQVRSSNITIRHNVFKDGCRDDHAPGTGCTAEIAFFGNQGDPTLNSTATRIHGNVIWKTITQHNSDGCILIEGADNGFISNNTIHKATGSGQCALSMSGANTAITNNIVSVPDTVGVACQATACDSNSIYTSAPPFADAVAGDFALTAALIGVNLASPDFDINGVRRAVDGVWDRGAFEFPGGGPGLPTAPVNLHIVR